MLTFEDFYSELKQIELCLRNVEPCTHFSIKNWEGVFEGLIELSTLYDISLIRVCQH